MLRVLGVQILCYRKAQDGQTVNFFRRSAVDLLISQFWISKVASNDFKNTFDQGSFKLMASLYILSVGRYLIWIPWRFERQDDLEIYTRSSFPVHVTFLVHLKQRKRLGIRPRFKKMFFLEVRHFIMSVRVYFYLCHKRLYQSILQVHFFSCADEDFPDRVKKSVNKCLTQRDIFWPWKPHIIHLF